MVKMKMYMCLALILSLTVGQNLWSMEKDEKDFFAEVSKSYNKYDVSAILDSLEEDREIVNAIDENEDTGLHIAAFKGNLELVLLLLLRGADANAINQEGETPLESAKKGLQGLPTGATARTKVFLAIQRVLERAQERETNRVKDDEKEVVKTGKGKEKGVGVGTVELASGASSSTPLPDGGSGEDATRDKATEGLPDDLQKQHKESNKNEPTKQGSSLWTWTKRGALGVVLAGALKLVYDNKNALESAGKQFVAYMAHKRDEHFGSKKEAARKAAKAS